MTDFPPVPAILKPCQTYMKLATDHEKIDSCITYWCRFHALQTGLKIDSKSKDNKEFFLSVMNWLETFKKNNSSDDTIVNEVVAQAHIENYGMKLFYKADEDDRSGSATKNTARQFFTAAQIFDLCAVFGDLNEELIQKSKYAKWRAAYIIKCIKSDEKPLPPEIEKNEETESNATTSKGFEANELSNLSLKNENESKSHICQNTSTNSPSNEVSNFLAMNGTKIVHDDILKAQKYSKWAMSALDYEDIKTAVDNLRKALKILEEGKEE